MGWLWLVVGILLIAAVNIRGAYHKGRMPKTFARIAWTIAGICFLFLALHQLGVKFS